MLAGTDRAGSTEFTTCRPHPMELLVPDPSGMAPLCGEEEFAAELAAMVGDEAPRLFAVVQEYGERVDGRIAAWGMAFDDHAPLVAVDAPVWMTLQAPEHALGRFTVGSRIRARLVWLDSPYSPGEQQRQPADRVADHQHGQRELPDDGIRAGKQRD